MTGLNPREQKLVAVGLAVLVLALAWLLVASPILQGFDARRSAREDMADTLRRDQRLVASFPRLRAERAALAADAPLYAFPTGDDGAARAAAEARVSAAVGAVGGALHAIRAQAARPGQVRLRAEAALTLPALVALLRRLQAERPYSAVEALNVAADPAAALGGAPGAGRGAPLEARFDVVYAYAAPVR